MPTRLTSRLRSRQAAGLLIAWVGISSLVAAPVAQQIRQPFSRVAITVTPDHQDWTYQPGEPVTFRIDVVRDGHQVAGAAVKYGIGPEMLPPVTEATATVGATPLTIAAGTMKDPGFLRLVATTVIDGRTYRGVGTAGFAPERILPTQTNPPDFDAFWDAERKRLAALPLDARWTPLPDYGTSQVECSQINLQNVGLTAGTSRLYGILCMPRAPGKYPAVLSVPGAGVRPYRGLTELAARGLITFQIGIHGIPVIQPQEVYDSLAGGGLSGYPTFGLDSRERYYYRRVLRGTLRANDFLTSLPQWDGRNLGVTGGSQGGALSIVTAGLDRRVTRLVAYHPALSDVTGYVNQRAGGWPHMFQDTLRVQRAEGKEGNDPLLRRHQLRSAAQGARLLHLGLQRQHRAADVLVRDVQHHHGAEAIDPRIRHRPPDHAGAGGRGQRLAGHRAHPGCPKQRRQALRVICL